MTEAFNLYAIRISSLGAAGFDFFEEMQMSWYLWNICHEAPGDNMREWQEEHLTRILDIRQRYLDFITPVVYRQDVLSAAGCHAHPDPLAGWYL